MNQQRESRHFDPRDGVEADRPGWSLCWSAGEGSELHVHPVYDGEVAHEISRDCFCHPFVENDDDVKLGTQVPMISHRRLVEIDGAWVELQDPAEA